jgi:hypothetical protein
MLQIANLRISFREKKEKKRNSDAISPEKCLIKLDN